MVKYIFILFLFTFGYSQKYDPKTGELIQEKQFDPKTGEVIHKEKNANDSLLNKEVLVILISGDAIRGKLIKDLDEKITISSPTIGSIDLERKNIKSITSGNARIVPAETSNNAIKSSNSNMSNLSSSPEYSEISNEAIKEAKDKNNHFINIVGGTGSAILWPTIPFTLLYLKEGKVPAPKSFFYKNLDEKSKTTYKKIYEKQYRRTRALQTITGPVVSCGVFVGSIIILGMLLTATS